MRQRAAATFAALTLAGVLLLNFKAPDDKALVTAIKTAASGTSPGTGTTTGTGATTGTGSPGTTDGAASGTGGGSTAAGTFTGAVAPDPYGDVQVQITVKNGKITDIQALSLPVGGHSGRISDYVAPILRSQALAAQSANIQGVSGATFTSQAYAQSLQGALDAAGL
ncbi:MAG: FMN-binding protein [Chloroflexi bacterium]|nr:FMN-binding protein [Chloroflexota bacterium]